MLCAAKFMLCAFPAISSLPMHSLFQLSISDVPEIAVDEADRAPQVCSQPPRTRSDTACVACMEGHHRDTHSLCVPPVMPCSFHLACHSSISLWRYSVFSYLNPCSFPPTPILFSVCPCPMSLGVPVSALLIPMSSTTQPRQLLAATA